MDRTDAEVCTSEIDSQVQALDRSVSPLTSRVKYNRTFSVPFGTDVTYVGIWLMVEPTVLRPSAVTTSSVQAAAG